MNCVFFVVVLSGVLMGWLKKAIFIFSAITIVFSAYLIGILYSIWPIESKTLAQAGVFGDSFGVLTALFSAYAFGGLIVTIFIQQEELSLTRELMRVQSFENNFFKLQDILHKIVENLDLQDRKTGKVNETGRDCFRGYVNELKILERYYKKKGKDVVNTIVAYDGYRNVRYDDLSIYFRFLFNVFKYIDSSDVENKYKYASIVRSQLSDSELLMIFYNCISSQGRKMVYYTEKYKIFDNLPVNLLLQSEHWNLYQRLAEDVRD